MAYPAVTYTFTNGTTADGANVSTNFTNLVSGLSDGTKDLNMNAATFAGNLTANGNIVLGNATSDTIILTGIVSLATSGSYFANLGGTVLLPTYTFTGDLNTGIWSSGADCVDLSTGGVSRFRVDANGDTQFGAITAPVSSTAGRKYITIESLTTAPAVIQLGNATGGAGVAMGQLEWYNRDNSGSASFRSAYIQGGVEGSTANNRGAYLSFGVKADGVSGSGTNALKIDSTGSLLINGTSTIGATAAKLQINDDQSTVGSISVNRFIASTSGGSIAFTKSRNATVGSHTVVQSGDSIGSIPFYGSDGTNYIVAAQISGAVDGTPGTNDMPGRLVFSTTADGASSLTERMRIDSSGRVGIGLTPSLYRLEVSGDIYNGGNKIITNRSGAAAWDSNGLHIQIDGTTYGKIGLDSSSMLRINTGLTVDGGQIKFPATQNPSSDANTLDDYEEGSWTPSSTGSGVLSTVGTITSLGTTTGYYTKIGNLVSATFTIPITNNGTGSGRLTVPLPFASATSISFGSGVETQATGVQLQVITDSGAATCKVVTYNNAYPGGTNYTVCGTITYRI